MAHSHIQTHMRLLTCASWTFIVISTLSSSVLLPAIPCRHLQAQSKFVQVMQERGFLHSCTNIEELDKQMKNGVVTAYLGFDATASSLHVGSLLQVGASVHCDIARLSRI